MIRSYHLFIEGFTSGGVNRINLACNFQLKLAILRKFIKTWCDK